MVDYLPALRADGDGTVIRIRVVPRASRTRLAGLHGDLVKLRVAAPPVEGRANEEVVAHLADALGLRARDLALVAGDRSRTKTVRVAGLAPPDVARRLADATP